VKAALGTFGLPAYSDARGSRRRRRCSCGDDREASWPSSCPPNIATTAYAMLTQAAAPCDRALRGAGARGAVWLTAYARRPRLRKRCADRAAGGLFARRYPYPAPRLRRRYWRIVARRYSRMASTEIARHRSNWYSLRSKDERAAGHHLESRASPLSRAEVSTRYAGRPRRAQWRRAWPGSFKRWVIAGIVIDDANFGEGHLPPARLVGAPA